MSRILLQPLCYVLASFAISPLLVGHATAEEKPDPPADGPVILHLDTPFYKDVQIDGKADDWQGRGYATAALQPMFDVELAERDLSGHMRVGWDNRGLVMLITVKDDVANEAVEPSTIHEMDSVELMVSDDSTDRNKLRFAISPGKDPHNGDFRIRTWDYRDSVEVRRVSAEPQVAVGLTKDGYLMEILVPWDALGIEPRAGIEIGFTLEVHDADKGHRRDHLRWGPADRNHSMGDAPSLNRLHLTPRHHALTRGPAAGNEKAA